MTRTGQFVDTQNSGPTFAELEGLHKPHGTQTNSSSGALSMVYAVSSFSIISSSSAGRSWNGELGRAFKFFSGLVSDLEVDIRAARLADRVCLRGELLSTEISLESLQAIFEEYPLRLKGEFEGVDSIFGGIWHGSRLLGGNQRDAILKLRFEAGSTDQPMHAHEHSHRAIIVLSGSGTFNVSAECLSEYSGHDIQSFPIHPGDVLAFSKGIVHSFETSESALTLLSYHSPFVPLEDARHFSPASSENAG